MPTYNKTPLHSEEEKLDETLLVENIEDFNQPLSRSQRRRKQNRQRCCEYVHIINSYCQTILLLAILTCLIGFALYLYPLIQEFDKDKESVNQLLDLIHRANDFMNKIESIPQVDWDFITNKEYQSKLISIIKEILAYWPNLPKF
jgi:predicted PurR-regulated permease PerM